MTDEFIKNCPLCFRKPSIDEYSRDGTRYWEIGCQNESHAVLVMHLTKGGALRRWNNGIEREAISDMIIEEKKIMDVMIGGTSDKKHTVTLPTSCVDPSEYKVGDSISYNIKGKVKSTDQEYGTVVELDEHEDGKDEEDMDQFEHDDPDTQERKIKKQMIKNKLEEY